ncbi:MAG: FAD-dependent oxidoreductase [Acidimicrobiales bacterium]
MTSNGLRAVVVGRSMAGLAAAAALSRHFGEVIIVDKDPDLATAEPRPGVGQGHHYHALAQGGQQSVERLLPGTVAELRSAGAVDVSFAEDIRFYDAGVWHPNRDLGLVSLNVTRGLLEHVVRERLRRESAVQVRGSTKLERLVFDGAGSGGADAPGRVTGVEVRGADGAVESITADLIVDCTGRVSKVTEVLTQHGYDPVQQFTLNIGISYTSALFRAPADAAGGFKVAIVLPEPPITRGGFVALVEDGLWMVSLHTRFERDLPRTHDEMVAFAETLEVPDVADFLRRATPQGDIRSFRKSEAVWRRFDKAARVPEGLLVLGDAMASFNPIFGQGMSVAWQEAVALDGLLADRSARNAGLHGLSAEFFPAAMPISRAAWSSSTLVDSAYEEVTGDRSPNVAQSLQLMKGVRRLLEDDPQLHADLVAVGQMTAAGDMLFTPERVARALAALDGP